MSPTGCEIKGKLTRHHEKPLDVGVLYVQKNPCGKRWKTMVDAGVLLGIPGLRTFVTYPNSIK